MKVFSYETNWELFTFGIPLSKDKHNNYLRSEKIDDEVPLKIRANEEWRCGDFPFDIIEIFLCIHYPFKPLVLFQQ
jgi:hypothetical protein